MNYSRHLDGLRGLAILLVILFHFKFILGVGWIGVQLFFVLSGFLITSILLTEKGNSIGYYLKRFYWRRTLRIFPLYFAYLFLVFAIYLVAHLPEDFMQVVPYLATYTFNFYPLIAHYSYEDVFFMHFWSLSVEEQFYLVWPLIIFLCNKRTLTWILFGIIFLAPVVRYTLGEMLLADGETPRYAGETLYRFTLSQLDGFAFGAMIPVLDLKNRKLPVGWLAFGTAFVLLALGVVNLFAINSTGKLPDLTSLGYEIGEMTNATHVWSYTLMNLLFMFVILNVITAEKEHPVTRILFGNPVMVYFGKISYGLYVYHFFIWMSYNKYVLPKIPNVALSFLIYMIICIVVATISFYLFEKPILSFKDKYFNHSKKSIQ